MVSEKIDNCNKTIFSLDMETGIFLYMGYVGFDLKERKKKVDVLVWVNIYTNHVKSFNAMLTLRLSISFYQTNNEVKLKNCLANI